MFHASSTSPFRTFFGFSVSFAPALWVVGASLLVSSVAGCASANDADTFETQDEDATGESSEALTRVEAGFVGIYENRASTGGDFTRIVLDENNRFEADVDVRHVALCLPGQSCTERREGTWTLRRSGANYALRLYPRRAPMELHTVVVGATEAAPFRLVRNGRSQSLSKRPLERIAGFTFAGNDVVLTPGPLETCPPTTTEAADACTLAGGQFRRAEGCEVVCSRPIAAGGDVAGFDFTGYRTARRAPAGQICTAILRPEEEACSRGGGQSQRTAGCGVLCTQPIATSPNVSGFDFSGLRVMRAPAPHVLCAPALGPVAEACEAAGGAKILANGCTHLCTVPVTRGMAPAPVTVEPFVTPLFAVPSAHPNPNCFVATRFDLRNGFAMPTVTLDEYVGGSCSLYVTPNPRRYSLTLEGKQCGSRVYTGTGKDDDGNAYTIRVTDHRDRYCEDIVPALFVVDEIRPGGLARTRYSY